MFEAKTNRCANGHEIHPDHKFCPECGAEAVVPVLERPRAPTTEPTPVPPPTNAWAIPVSGSKALPKPEPAAWSPPPHPAVHQGDKTSLFVFFVKDGEPDDQAREVRMTLTDPEYGFFKKHLIEDRQPVRS